MEWSGHSADVSLWRQVSTLQADKFEVNIVKETPNYLYAEFQSPTFGFIDDVEFFFTGKPSHMRAPLI